MRREVTCVANIGIFFKKKFYEQHGFKCHVFPNILLHLIFFKIKINVWKINDQ